MIVGQGAYILLFVLSQWSNMQTIWITGGKGFIGRNLAQYVSSEQCEVYGLGHGLWSKQGSDEWSYRSWLNADIEFASLNQLASESGLPDVLYHLAGGAAVGPSIQNPYEDFRRTVDTTARLLDWVREKSPSTKVIATSSAAVYGAGFDKAISEDVIPEPYSPYGFHKYMLENLFKSYRATYGLDLRVIRFFSVYGAGLEKQLLWDLCSKLANSDQKKITLNGNGNEVRDWLHIQDAVKLLWKVGRADTAIHMLNGGTGIPTTIKQIATKVINAWGGDFVVDFNEIARKGDPQSLLADTNKAKSFGFVPQVLIDDGIEEVVEWFKARVV